MSSLLMLCGTCKVLSSTIALDLPFLSWLVPILPPSTVQVLTTMACRPLPATAINILKLVDLSARSGAGEFGGDHTVPQPKVLDPKSAPSPSTTASSSHMALSVVFIPLSLLVEHMEGALATNAAGANTIELCDAPSASLLQPHTKSILRDPDVSAALQAATRQSVPAMKVAGEKSASGILSALLLRTAAGGGNLDISATYRHWVLVVVTHWSAAVLLQENKHKAKKDVTEEAAARASQKISRAIKCSLKLMKASSMPLANRRPIPSALVWIDMPLLRVELQQAVPESGPDGGNNNGGKANNLSLPFLKMLVDLIARDVREAPLEIASFVVLSEDLAAADGIEMTSPLAQSIAAPAGATREQAAGPSSRSLLLAAMPNNAKRPRNQSPPPPPPAAAAVASNHRPTPNPTGPPHPDVAEEDEEDVDLDDVPLLLWARARQAARLHEMKYGADRIVLAPLGRPAALFVSLSPEDAIASGANQHLRELFVLWSSPAFESRGETMRLIFLVVDADDVFERTLLSWTTCPHADNYGLLPIFVASIAARQTVAARSDEGSCDFSSSASGVNVAATMTSLGSRFCINWDDSIFVGSDSAIVEAFRATRLTVISHVDGAVLALRATAGVNYCRRRANSPSRRHATEDVFRQKIGLFRTLVEHQRRPEVILCQDRSLRLGLVRPPRDLKHTLAGMSIREQQLMHITAAQRKQFDGCMKTIFGAAAWQSSMMQYLRDGKLPYQTVAAGAIKGGSGSTPAPLVSFFTPVVLGCRVFQLLGWVNHKTLRVQVHLDLNPLVCPSPQHQAILQRPDGCHVDDLCEVFFPGKSKCWSCPCSPRLDMSHHVTPRDARKLCRHVQYMIQYFLDVHVGATDPEAPANPQPAPQVATVQPSPSTIAPAVASSGLPPVAVAATSASKPMAQAAVGAGPVKAPAAGGRLLAARSPAAVTAPTAAVKDVAQAVLLPVPAPAKQVAPPIEEMVDFSKLIAIPPHT